MKNPDRTVLALFAAAILWTAAPAYAGPLTGTLAYFQDNIATDIETLGIIAVAVIMFSMQIRWYFVIGVCAGIWLLANADTVRQTISGG